RPARLVQRRGRGNPCRGRGRREARRAKDFQPVASRAERCRAAGRGGRRGRRDACHRRGPPGRRGGRGHARSGAAAFPGPREGGSRRSCFGGACAAGASCSPDVVGHLVDCRVLAGDRLLEQQPTHVRAGGQRGGGGRRGDLVREDGPGAAHSAQRHGQPRTGPSSWRSASTNDVEDTLTASRILSPCAYQL
ncbi:unnamed protein product, partial [Prorocentrum cordatum]